MLAGLLIMSQKRHQEDGKGRSEGTGSPEDKRRRLPTFHKYEPFYLVSDSFCFVCIGLSLQTGNIRYKMNWV